MYRCLLCVSFIGGYGEKRKRDRKICLISRRGRRTAVKEVTRGSKFLFQTIQRSKLVFFFVHSDEANNACATVEVEEWKRPRSESSTGADNDSVYMHGSIYLDHHRKRRQVCKNDRILLMNQNMSVFLQKHTGFLVGIWRIRSWCVAWWHSGREESDTEEESPSEQGQGSVTPISLDTPLQSSVSRCTSLNVIR